MEIKINNYNYNRRINYIYIILFLSTQLYIDPFLQQISVVL